jgi:hypothetical protein
MAVRVPTVDAQAEVLAIVEPVAVGSADRAHTAADVLKRSRREGAALRSISPFGTVM